MANHKNKLDLIGIAQKFYCMARRFEENHWALWRLFSELFSGNALACQK